MTALDKTYTPTTIESHWYDVWEKNGYFAPHGKGEPYCILLPPPNVTGSLHMGHGFGFTLIDVLIRYQRMCGKNTLWQGGVDHAGIATQMVVERRLNAEGHTRHDYGRERFVEAIWQWKAESGDRINHQLRRLGASIDWMRSRFTMDDDYSAVVQDAFIRLYDEKLIYRGKRLVNWDPVLLTAISDLEVNHTEEEGAMWYIRYPLQDGKTTLTVATTRPETMLGDVAVAVHPDDERYQAYIGQLIQLPLCHRTIPIIADEAIDPTFGTGCVKVTPAHDFNDYAIGLRHHLTPINIFTPTAHLNEETPKPYQGLDRIKARAQIVQDLEALGLLEKKVKHTLQVPRGDRSGAVIEPYLTLQWYVKTSALSDAAIRAVKEKEIRFVPENWDKTYFQWMTNIEDWCISRQLWWGHRIPVWYNQDGEAYVGQNELDVRTRYHLPNDLPLTQDDDVLDTWFSSSLWPLVTLGSLQMNKSPHSFFPTQTLITGFDIIFFWVARMIMMSLYFTKQVPFHEVYITGLIRDKEGHKMSKSKGNVLDPLDLIDGITLDQLTQKRTQGLMQPTMAKKISHETHKEYPNGIKDHGTDALRMTFCSMAAYTREIRFDMNRLEGYRHFCNKLWNAARYVLMNCKAKQGESSSSSAITQFSGTLSLPDRWIIARLQQTIVAAHHALKQYRFDLFAQHLYDFTWNAFCDWYLELSKPLLMQSESEEAAGTRYTLLTVLETLLRLLHPIMPFITEDIWQRVKTELGKNGESIMLEPYPIADETNTDQAAIDECQWLQNIITAIRTLRSERQISPRESIPLLLRQGSVQDKAYDSKHRILLVTLAKLKDITWLNTNDTPPPAASTVVGELEIFIPMDQASQQDERERLQKEIAKIEIDIALIKGKLQNPQFIDRAPLAVVEKEKTRYTELSTTLAKLKALNFNK